jgi:hypothetical protein
LSILTSPYGVTDPAVVLDASPLQSFIPRSVFTH